MKPEDLPDLRGLRFCKDYQTFEYNPRDHVLVGDRPFVIFAMLLDRTLGDFIYRNLFAASVRLRFRDARLIVYYRPDRPYKDAVVSLNPYISSRWCPTGSRSLPLDGFDYMGDPPVPVSRREWYHSLSAEPDLVLTPSMMNLELLRGLSPLARFSVPEEQVPALHERALAHGLSEDRWYCVLHYRQAGYRNQDARAHRDLDHHHADAVIEHVIRSLGGQVVRIGHDAMTEMPARDGFIDLSREADPLMLHAYVVSRARFFLELSPSGPMALAGAFGVPMARCNAVSGFGPLEAPSFSLMQHIVGDDGTRISRDIALSKGLYAERAVNQVIGRYGYGFVRNSVDELKSAANDIHDRTRDCTGWRTAGPPKIGDFTEHYTVPLPEPPEIEIVEYPDAMPSFR